MKNFVIANFDKKAIWRVFQYGGSGNEFSFFRDINVTNDWFLHFYQTYDHQTWKVCTPIEVNIFETNQIVTGDVITLR